VKALICEIKDRRFIKISKKNQNRWSGNFRNWQLAGKIKYKLRTYFTSQASSSLTSTVSPTFKNIRGLFMNKPLFSIIMPTYNRATIIVPVIDSILNQEFSDFELIIIDDGSTDNTLEILHNLEDPRIKIIVQENNRQTQARKKGCECALGKFFAFCDSDDMWVPNYLSDLKTVFAEYNADYIFTNYQVEGELKPRIDLDNYNTALWLNKNACQIADNIYHFNDLYSALIEYQPIFCSCQAITKKHYFSIGGISEKINNKKLGTVQTSEDTHVMRRSALTNNSYFIDKTSVVLGRQGDNVSSSFTSNLRGGLNILIDILKHTKLSNNHKNLTRISIEDHRQALAKQIYYFEPKSNYIKHYLSQPKLQLCFKNHVHFFLSFLKK
jgi:glycosyltransferase involved in cell wall biosynthesis